MSYKKLQSQVSIPKGAIMRMDDTITVQQSLGFNSKRCDYELHKLRHCTVAHLFQFQKVRL